jgi:hypothetical protein
MHAWFAHLYLPSCRGSENERRRQTKILQKAGDPSIKLKFDCINIELLMIENGIH